MGTQRGSVTIYEHTQHMWGKPGLASGCDAWDSHQGDSWHVLVLPPLQAGIPKHLTQDPNFSPLMVRVENESIKCWLTLVAEALGMADFPGVKGRAAMGSVWAMSSWSLRKFNIQTVTSHSSLNL
jgi:hypothetical protein